MGLILRPYQELRAAVDPIPLSESFLPLRRPRVTHCLILLELNRTHILSCFGTQTGIMSTRHQAAFRSTPAKDPKQQNLIFLHF